jgi:hypothetical protein
MPVINFTGEQVEKVARVWGAPAVQFRLHLNNFMGHFHISLPENGRNGRRHYCIYCGKHRKEIFMEKINEWHQGQWKCNTKYKNCKKI